MTRWGVPLLAAATVLFVPAAPALAASAATVPVDRKITDDRVDENSGFAPSSRRAGLLWTNEDSDNPARIYGIGPSGKTVATYSLTNLENTDWEAIAALRGPDRTPWLAVGDIGDNRASRAEITVALFPEPASKGDTRGAARYVLHLRYPAEDGAQDAETLLADPRTGRLYLVTKGLLGGRLYAVPPATWPRPAAPGQVQQPTARLLPMASVPLTLATDGAIAPDGRIVLRTYEVIATLPPPEQDTQGVAQPLGETRLPSQEQGESLALLPGATEALVGSEGKNQPVYRVTVPGPAAAASTKAAVAGATTAASRTTAGGASRLGGEVADAETKQSGNDQNDIVLQAALAAGGLGALVAAWFGLSRQFRVWSARRRQREHVEIHVERVEDDVDGEQR